MLRITEGVYTCRYILMGNTQVLCHKNLIIMDNSGISQSRLCNTISNEVFGNYQLLNFKFGVSLLILNDKETLLPITLQNDRRRITYNIIHSRECS